MILKRVTVEMINQNQFNPTARDNEEQFSLTTFTSNYYSI